MSEPKVKRPASQFYWDEYFGDKRLRLCSSAARGLWMDMLCIMHQGEPYGHLTFEGKTLNVRDLAKLCGISVTNGKRWLTELSTNSIYSVDDDGRIYSRRMVRDELLRNARAAGGPLGGEHGGKGAEHGAKGGRPRGVNKPPSMGGYEKPPLKPPPSSSSSSSSSIDASSQVTRASHQPVDNPGSESRRSTPPAKGNRSHYEARIVAEGKAKGLNPRVGESLEDFESRVRTSRPPPPAGDQHGQRPVETLDD